MLPRTPWQQAEVLDGCRLPSWPHVVCRFRSGHVRLRIPNSDCPLRDCSHHIWRDQIAQQNFPNWLSPVGYWVWLRGLYALHKGISAHDRTIRHLLSPSFDAQHQLSLPNNASNEEGDWRPGRTCFLAVFNSQYRTFLNNIYSSEKRVPSWVKTALDLAQIQIELEHPYYEEKEKGPKE